MKEVKSISLALENCESISIDRKFVGEFLCNNITSRVFRIACNSIAKQQLCDELFIEINEDANVKYSCFGQESEEPAFDRLTKCPDVVGVEIVYEDDSSDYLLVPWNEDNDYANKYLCKQVWPPVFDGQQNEDRAGFVERARCGRLEPGLAMDLMVLEPF